MCGMTDLRGVDGFNYVCCHQAVHGKPQCTSHKIIQYRIINGVLDPQEGPILG